MISLIFFAVAAVVFFAAGTNATLFGQSELDEVAFGLFILTLGLLFDGVGPKLKVAKEGR